jgi:DHA2 family multidrug resistance protein
MTETAAEPGATVPVAASERVSARTWAAFLVMFCGMYVTLINVQIVSSSFKQIQGGLSAGADQISWVLTAALIAEVVMIPLSGWLSRLLSTRWLFTFCLGGFTLATFGCATAANIEMMIVFRALQGFSGGALMPMTLATMYLSFPPRLTTVLVTAMALFGVSSVAVGPVLGGWLTETLGWRWIFWINLPFALIFMVLGSLLMRFDEPDRELARHIDFLGITLAAIFLGSLLVVLQEGQRRDWFDSDLIVALSVIAALAAYLFMWREFSTRHPVVDLRVFASRDFSIACFFIAIFGALLYVPLFILPLFLAEVRGIDTFAIGTITAVLGTSMVISGFTTSVMLRYMRRRTVAALGFSGLALGTWLQGFLTAEYGFAELVLPQVLRGFSSQMCWLSLVTLAVGGLPASQVKNGTALFNTVMRLGAGIALAVANTMLVVRARVHYAEIASGIPAGRVGEGLAVPTAQSMFHALYGVSPEATRAGIVVIANIAEREALIRAYNDVTLGAALVCVASLLLLPLMRGRRLQRAR